MTSFLVSLGGSDLIQSFLREKSLGQVLAAAASTIIPLSSKLSPLMKQSSVLPVCIPHLVPFAAELDGAEEGTKEEVMVAKFCAAAPTKAHSEAAEVIRYKI